MERRTGIMKYNFTSIGIRRLLEVGNEEMINVIKYDLERFIEFVEIKITKNSASRDRFFLKGLY